MRGGSNRPRPGGILAAALIGLLAAASPAFGQLAEPPNTRALLATAETALAKPARDETRLAAIGRAIRAHEAALADLRRRLHDFAAEREAISERMAVEEPDLGALLSILQAHTNAPDSALLIYPDGPVDAARAAALLADIEPALSERASKLEDRLARLATLEREQAEAEAEARAVLASLGRLRTAGVSALDARETPPDAAMEHPEIEGDATLDALADALGRAASGPRLGFDSARGRLPLPVVGEVTDRFGAPGPAERGWTIAAPGYAQVLAPWDGTVRYAAPFGTYGNVMVLEPETGYLMVLAGLGRIDREVGEVVLAGEMLGDMGGALPGEDEFLFEAASDDDLIGPETLYLELRRKGGAVDPADWFRDQDG